jgi:hypothetical protein
MVMVSWTDKAALLFRLERLEAANHTLRQQLAEERQRTAAVRREAEALKLSRDVALRLVVWSGRPQRGK